MTLFHTMPEHVEHQGEPDHPHGPGCGHPSAHHAGQHVDYLVNGHAHHAHEGHWDECDVEALAGHEDPRYGQGRPVRYRFLSTAH